MIHVCLVIPFLDVLSALKQKKDALNANNKTHGCSSNNDCTYCESGYFLNTSDSLCYACSVMNCDTASNYSVCSATERKCSCTQNTSWSDSGFCILNGCPHQNCTKCIKINNYFCDICATGYFLNQNQTPNCNTCRTLHSNCTHCTECFRQVIPTLTHPYMQSNPKLRIV